MDDNGVVERLEALRAQAAMYTTEARALFALFCRHPSTDDCVAALAEWLRARDGKDAE